jgi:AraC-like DNA-binding protein
MHAMLLACRPALPLSLSVEMLWYCEHEHAAHRQERVLPIPRFQLIVDLAGSSSVVLGMRSRHSIIDASLIESMMGVVFRPGAARRFFGPPADAFANRAIALEAVWGRDAAELRGRLQDAPTAAAKFAILERALLRAADDRMALHAAVRQGLAEFETRPRVRRVLDVVKDAGVSRRRFAQLFREQVGLTPKRYCRLLRFRQVVEAVDRAGDVDWADVAAAGGYCDQAHLVHDFGAFSGMTPGAFLRSRRPSLNHVVVE